MVKARELVAVDQIKFAIKTIDEAVKSLDGLEVGHIIIRIKEPKRWLEGLEPAKGAMLLEAFTTSGFDMKDERRDEKRPKIDYMLGLNGSSKCSVHFEIAEEQLARLKAEQERIAAQIAALEGEAYGTA